MMVDRFSFYQLKVFVDEHSEMHDGDAKFSISPVAKQPGAVGLV
jgi:hypothetical protein